MESLSLPLTAERWAGVKGDTYVQEESWGRAKWIGGKTE